VKLTILTQYYPPEIGAPQRRLSHLAELAAASGHEVTVLTAMPNYPSGKIYSGYGGGFRREHRAGVELLRTAIYPSQTAALAPRLLSYLSFVFSSILFGSVLLKRSDFLLVESPPLFLGLAGIWLSRCTRARLIFNVSDLWPASAVSVGAIGGQSFAYRMGLRLEALCYRRAWLVTGQSQSILNDIGSRFPGVSTLLLSNGADTAAFHPRQRTDEARARLTSSNEFVVLYAGLHGLAQGLRQVLDAAGELSEDGVRFVLIGDGPEKRKLVEAAGRDGLNNVTFLDPAPAAEMPALLASADAIVVPLGMCIPGAVPSKLYEAMASARPIILVAGCEPAEIVRKYDAGIVVEPGQAHELAAAVREIRRHPERGAEMAGNARRAAVERFDRGEIARSFLAHLEQRLAGVGSETPMCREPKQETKDAWEANAGA
jgi:colanic acid biosynthesis glycosyl transferase WcaI